MARSGFNFKQYEKWVKDLGVAKNEFDIFLKQFLLEMAQRVISRGKFRTPVDTGYLRNSWYIGSQNIEQLIHPETGMAIIDKTKSDIASISVVGNTMYVEIGLSAEYASYIEYGHHNYMGRYMMTISVDEIQKQIPKRFEQEFKEFIKKYGV